MNPIISTCLDCGTHITASPSEMFIYDLQAKKARTKLGRKVEKSVDTLYFDYDTEYRKNYESLFFGGALINENSEFREGRPRLRRMRKALS